MLHTDAVVGGPSNGSRSKEPNEPVAEGHLTLPERRRVTVSEVAEAAGVSAMTVSRVVNGSARVAPATREAVEKAMDELAYIPNRVARGLVKNRLEVLGLAVPDLSNQFFTSMARSIEATASERGYSLILTNTQEDAAKETNYLRLLAGLQIDGMIIVPCSDKSGHAIEQLQQRGVLCVLIDRQVPGLDIDVVRGESIDAAYRLTQHLIEHGHTKIAMITGPTSVSTARDRETGFARALKDAGLKIPRRYVRHARYNRAAGAAAALSLLQLPEPPTAMFASNNFVGFGVIDAARELGLRLPADLAVVTFDDVELAAEAPFLTSAAQPTGVMGSTAATMLIDRIEGDRSPWQNVVLESEIVLRRSCGCAGEAPHR